MDGHSLKKIPFIGFHMGRKNVIHPIAPGTTACDGKTAEFFKATWSIVGDEVTAAISDLFRNGKILKEINA